jgi:hypothetical protein
LDKTAQEALVQIQEKNYASRFDKDTPVLMIGMAFFKKQMKTRSTLFQKMTLLKES